MPQPLQQVPKSWALACEGNGEAANGCQKHPNPRDGGPSVVRRIVVQNVALAILPKPDRHAAILQSFSALDGLSTKEI